MPAEILETILDAVGNTPLVRLSRLAESTRTPLVAKVESLNPGGSVKDRIGLAMIEAAEQAGHLHPGATIVEPTSGNTGTGLAIAAALKGYRLVCVMPDKMSSEKIALLRAYGAEVVVCPTAVARESPQSYYSVADRLAREIPGAFQPNQYFNPANPAAHEATTGPEIWRQTDGRITHFVAGMGTGGTITGVARVLKQHNPAIQIVGADPVGSIYSAGADFTPKIYKVEGIGEDFMPSTMDMPFVGVQARDTVRAAIDAMQQYGISQLPVVETDGGSSDTRMVGSIQERTLLDRVYRDPTLVESAVGAAMDPPFPTIARTAEMDDAFYV